MPKGPLLNHERANMGARMLLRAVREGGPLFGCGPVPAEEIARGLLYRLEKAGISADELKALSRWAEVSAFAVAEDERKRAETQAVEMAVSHA